MTSWSSTCSDATNYCTSKSSWFLLTDSRIHPLTNMKPWDWQTEEWSSQKCLQKLYRNLVLNTFGFLCWSRWKPNSACVYFLPVWNNYSPCYCVSWGFVWALCAAEGCFVATVTTFVNIGPVCGGLHSSFLPKSALFLSQPTCQINLYPCWLSDAHDRSCSKSSPLSRSSLFIFSWSSHVTVPPETIKSFT